MPACCLGGGGSAAAWSLAHLSQDGQLAGSLGSRLLLSQQLGQPQLHEAMQKEIKGAACVLLAAATGQCARRDACDASARRCEAHGTLAATMRDRQAVMV